MRIYHVHLKRPFKHKQQTDYYFTSAKKLFDNLTHDQLGIGINSFYTHFRGGPYENKKCVITRTTVNNR